jgi:hypothetical protein
LPIEKLLIFGGLSLFNLSENLTRIPKEHENKTINVTEMLFSNSHDAPVPQQLKEIKDKIKQQNQKVFAQAI